MSQMPPSTERNESVTWIRLCAATEAPAPGTVMEVETGGRAICLANIDGELAALDNICPHRLGPLGQGWIEGGAVICPWHSWAFDPKTGVAASPDRGQVEVFPLKVEGDSVLIAMSEREPETEPLTDEEIF